MVQVQSTMGLPYLVVVVDEVGSGGGGEGGVKFDDAHFTVDCVSGGG